MRVEHEYERLGACVYLAAWEVHPAKLFGRCELHNGIAAFGRLVEQVMLQEPYYSADRVFWIVDYCGSHRAEACVKRLQSQWKSIEVIHTPIHASWLNQIEIYFSIIQRKVLTPNDFQSLDELMDRRLAFQEYYEKTAKPF